MEEGEREVAGYKPFYQTDAEAFLRLYRKYLDWKLNKLKDILSELPTDVIERIFDGVGIHKKEDELFISFGFNDVQKVERELEAYFDLANKGRLVEFLERYGHKVNEKKIGVRK